MLVEIITIQTLMARRGAVRNMPLVLETRFLSTFIHSLTNFTFIYVPSHPPVPPSPRHINSHYLLPYVFVPLQFVFLILTFPNLLFSIFYVFSISPSSSAHYYLLPLSISHCILTVVFPLLWLSPRFTCLPCELLSASLVLQ
jgi:hypothetical protein